MDSESPVWRGEPLRELAAHLAERVHPLVQDITDKMSVPAALEQLPATFADIKAW